MGSSVTPSSLTRSFSGPSIRTLARVLVLDEHSDHRACRVLVGAVFALLSFLAARSGDRRRWHLAEQGQLWGLVQLGVGEPCPLSCCVEARGLRRRLGRDGLRLGTARQRQLAAREPRPSGADRQDSCEGTWVDNRRPGDHAHDDHETVARPQPSLEPGTARSRTLSSLSSSCRTLPRTGRSPRVKLKPSNRGFRPTARLSLTLHSVEATPSFRLASFHVISKALMSPRAMPSSSCAASALRAVRTIAHSDASSTAAAAQPKRCSSTPEDTVRLYGGRCT